jgi:NAD(P)-dependent dehydrogenase (short-subunit alcohol dehydrogenase family)
MRYQDKAVIITGGSRGIGAGCARVFVEAGAVASIADRDERGGSALAAELNRGSAGKACFIACDVTREADIENLIAETIKLTGRIDCLINNAGWHPPHKSIDDFSAQEFRDLLELNLVSMFTACKLALPHLRRTSGNIINMSSLVARIGQHHAVTYVATKGAITAFTKALAIDEAVYGVRVNSVSPGNIYTPLWQEVIDNSSDPAESRADGEAAQLLRRLGTEEEVGRLCLYLAAGATFTTGVDHIISGGAELGYGRKFEIGGEPQG